MTERIHLEPITGLNPHDIEITSSEEFKKGGVETKTRHTRVIDRGETQHKISLVERDDEGGYYEKQWKIFKEAGLPVVPTLRKTEKGTVVMTDLRADGSELYGKSLQWRAHDVLHKYYEKTRMIKSFSKIQNWRINFWKY